jgi:prepilin-type N-terminal cleavage/methylation domain-containing protein
MNKRGFTLLEMMIAMAILSGALTWLVTGMSRNIRAENHAKMMTTATFLARGAMTKFEDELYEKGFGEFEKCECKDFEDKGFSKFSYCICVDKVELPGQDQVQSIMTKAQEAKSQLTGDASKSSSSSPTTPQNPMTAGAAAMSSSFGIIKDVLEQGIRRVTVDVKWKEGKKEHKVNVITYFTDPRRVDQAINLNIPTNLPGQTPPNPQNPPPPPPPPR